MPLYRLEDRMPIVAPSAYIAEGAQVIGRVELAELASVWFNAVLRGDNDWIRVGEGSNIQESSVLHTDPGHPLAIGARVTIGHQVMLHGCTIGDGSLIGIQSVVLNGARIGKGCLIGAGSLITEHKEIPDYSLVMGSPAKVVRTLAADDAARLLRSAESYIERARLFRDKLERL